MVLLFKNDFLTMPCARRRAKATGQLTNGKRINWLGCLDRDRNLKGKSMANEHDREREDEDELDRDIMDRDEGIAVDEAASSATCAICGKEIPHGLRPECDEGGKVFCDGCAKV